MVNLNNVHTSNSFVDIAVIILSVFIIAGSVWVWLAAAPISREVVLLASTITLIVSLILVVNISVLVILRLHRRVSHLESVISVQSPQEPVEPQRDRIVVVTLSNTERRIINRLEENSGSLTQDELRRITGLSKSTLSVSLSALERKSLIRREIHGRTKLVILNSELKR